MTNGMSKRSIENVAQWLENGCDPKNAAKELRLIAEALDAVEPAKIVYRCQTFADTGLNRQCTLILGHNGQCNFGPY